VSAGEQDALRRQFVDVAHRLSHVHFAINYGDPWADEFLDNSVVRVLLAARLLYAQRQPPYIRPNNRLDEALLHRWVNNERGTGGSMDMRKRAEGPPLTSAPAGCGAALEHPLLANLSGMRALRYWLYHRFGGIGSLKHLHYTPRFPDSSARRTSAGVLP